MSGVLTLVMALALRVEGEPAAAPGTTTAVADVPTVVASSERTDDGPVAITTRVSPDPSNIGDLLVLEVVAAFPRGISVNVPAALSLEPLHLVDIEESEPEPTGEGLRKVITIRLQRFLVGSSTVPGFDLTYVTGSGEVHTVAVPPSTFEVESLLANEADPSRQPDDPPISIEYPNTLAQTVIYSVLATALVGLLLWLALRRALARDRSVALEPPTPPHERALAALDALVEADLVGREKFVEHYLELTEITKAYLEGRFGVEALDRTTDELAEGLRRQAGRIDPIDVSDLISHLHAWDLVKFARFAPGADEAAAATGYVRDIVERTMPRPTQDAEPPADERGTQEVA